LKFALKPEEEEVSVGISYSQRIKQLVLNGDKEASE